MASISLDELYEDKAVYERILVELQDLLQNAQVQAQQAQVDIYRVQGSQQHVCLNIRVLEKKNLEEEEK